MEKYKDNKLSNLNNSFLIDTIYLYHIGLLVFRDNIFHIELA